MARRRGPRKVRTPGGAKLYGQPIGTIITRDMVERAKRLIGMGSRGRDDRSAPRRGSSQGRAGASPARGGTGRGAPGNVRIQIDRERTTYDTVEEARAAGVKNLPEQGSVHRYSTDPQEERKGRYLEAIAQASSEDDLNKIIVQLGNDPGMEPDEWEEIIDALRERSGNTDKPGRMPKPEDFDKPVTDAPDTPDAPERPAERPQAPESPQERDPAPNNPQRAAERRKKPPSAQHKKRLERSLEQALHRGHLNEIERKAKAWEEEGFIDAKTRADIERKVRNHENYGENSLGLDPKEMKAELNEYLAAGKNGDRGALTSGAYFVDEAHKQGLLTDKERDSWQSKFDDAVLQYPEDQREDRFVLGDWTTDGDDTGSLSSKDRNYVLNPKEPDTKSYDAYIKQLANDPDNTPAGRELAAGKDISELENPEGLEQYMDAHPERFERREMGGNSGSGAFQVLDNETGKKHFFKRATNNGPVGMMGDGINEVLVGKLGREAFPDLFLDADFAERPEHGGNPLIRLEHVDEKAEALGSKITFYDASLYDWESDIKDRKQPLALHLFDYLTNQTDRNMGNIAWHEYEDGKIGLLATDNAAAFSAYDGYTYGWTLDEDGNETDLRIGMIDNPEDVSYEEWAQTYAGSENQNLSKQANVIGMIAGQYDDAQLEKDVKAVIAQFAKVDIDAQIADLKRRFPNMDEYERKHMEAAAAIWKKRMATLKKDRRVTDHMIALMEQMFSGGNE